LNDEEPDVFSTFIHPSCSIQDAFSGQEFGMGSGGIITCAAAGTLTSPTLLEASPALIMEYTQTTDDNSNIVIDNPTNMGFVDYRDANVDFTFDVDGYITSASILGEPFITADSVAVGLFRIPTVHDKLVLNGNLDPEQAKLRTATQVEYLYANYSAGHFEKITINCDTPCQTKNTVRINLQPSTFINDVCRVCFCTSNLVVCPGYQDKGLIHYNEKTEIDSVYGIRDDSLVSFRPIGADIQLASTAGFTFAPVSVVKLFGIAMPQDFTKIAPMSPMKSGPIDQSVSFVRSVGCPALFQPLFGYPLFRDCAPGTSRFDGGSLSKVTTNHENVTIGGIKYTTPQLFSPVNPSVLSSSLPNRTLLRCPSGFYASNGECVQCSTIESGYHQLVPCSLTKDALWKRHTVCDECVVVAGTASQDAICGHDSPVCPGPEYAIRQVFEGACIHCVQCTAPRTGYTADQVAQCALNKFRTGDVVDPCDDMPQGECNLIETVVAQANIKLRHSLNAAGLTVQATPQKRVRTNPGVDYVYLFDPVPAGSVTVSDVSSTVPAGLRCPRGQFLYDADEIPQCRKAKRCYYYEKKV
jgi:hypothetical protein